MPTKIKVLTVKRVIEGKSSVTSIARELGVARKTIYSWLKTYKSAARRNRKTCLAAKYIKGSAHPKEYVHTLEQKMIRLIKTDPTLSVSKMAEKLNAGHHAIYNLLKALNLNTEDSRLAYCNIYAHPGIFDPEIKLSAVRKVVSSEGCVTDVARELRVSRKTIYSWLKEYKENGIVKNNYLSGFDHPRSLGQEAEAKILSKVVKAPELSIHALASELNYSSHAIFNVLSKNLLTHKNARIIYSQAQIARVSEEPQKAGLSERIKSVFETFTPNLAPAPPPKFLSILKTFFISSGLTSLVTFGSLFWFSVITGGGSFAAGVGLVFAFVALAAGTFFFLYSLKYYITTSLLLSFSNREDKNKINLKTPGMNADLDSVHVSRYPFVSIHIPFYNEKNVVERSIKAATNFNYPAYEVILCDDSTDETTEKIRRYQETCLFKGESLKITKGEGWTLTEVEVKPGVTLKHLHRTTRSGYKGGALALALKLVDPRTEFVSIFDADFVPYSDSLNLFLKYFKVANGMEENYTKGNLAAVQGYQWHVLNKSENWVTKGVRTEYAGSYVIERSAIEIYKGLKQISGSVYMIRRDVLNQIGWGTSITEDFELTLKLYDAGYKVAYTPYIQAPAECVSTLKRMIRQRMRWAEGHSFNVKTMAWKLLRNPKLSFAEKFEFTYLMPYYLQAFFFLVGTFCWFISEAVFKVRLPFWTELWGWSMVLTNMVSLPLMNFVGMFMEESDKKDYSGLASFVALSYIIVPFQAYAAVKGFLEKREGPWFRTPKTGHITDSYIKSTFFRFIQGFIPKGAEVHQDSAAQYLALSSANNRFDKFTIAQGRGRKWKARGFLAILLIISNLLISMAPSVPYFVKPKVVQAQSFDTVNNDQNNTQTSQILPEKNFEKGVLAVNSNKQEFLQAEEVYIQMASLDDRGHTLCNSDLELEIEYPGMRVDKFTTNGGGIVNSTTCGNDNVTDSPDYFVKFRPVDTGVYVLRLINIKNDNQVTNSFNVVESQSLSVERISATRINPSKSDYQMTVKFKANEDTSQTFKDVIPEGFNITDSNNVSVNLSENNISMQVDLKKGQEKTFTYRYQAPEVSPELYTINGWQIASDATRMYVSNAAADKTLPSVQGTWSDSSSSLTKALGSKSGSAATQAFTGSATNANNLIGRWQSLPLSSDTSFSTSNTVQYVIGAKSSNTTNTVMHFRVHIFVIESDGSTVRGTLLNNYTGAGTAFTTTATGRTDSTRSIANNVSAKAGDRIVVEIGCNRTGSDTSSKTCTFNYGNTGTTDLTSGNTSVTTRPGWVEFSNDFSTAAGTAPTVTTQAVSDITSSTATGNGNVTLDNGFPITERGAVWNTAGTPTTADSKATASGTTGAFTASITSLTPAITYYVRAYAINSQGTSYGSEVSFISLGVNTHYSFQRKTWYDGTRYWKTYETGSEIQFWYSTTGSSWTQNTSATITISSSDFSIEADTTDLFIVYTSGYDVEALEANEANYPGTSWGWKAAATKVYDGSSSTDAFNFPTITRDTDTKVWIMATHHSGSNYIIKSLQSTSTNDIAAWGSVSSVDTSTNSNKYGVINALASGSMYAVWIDGTAIEGSKYTAGGGGGTVDKSITATADDGTEMIYGANKSFDTVQTYGTAGIYYSSPTSYEFHTFLRFTGVTITGTITSSYIKVYAHDATVADSGAGYPKVNIYGVKQDNPSAPTTYTEMDNLTLTSAVVTWDGQDWSTDTQYQSGSLNSIFQEISDNFTISNDAVIVQLRSGSNPAGYSNYQNVYDYTGNSSYVATLHIEYSSGGWEAASSIATGTSGLSTNLSALSDASHNIHLSYIDSSGHTVYQEYTTSWQAATTLDSNSGNTYTSISLNTSDNTLYVFWIRDVSGTKHIYYKNSSDWTAAATDWHSGTNLTNFSSNISGSGTTKIFGEWTSETGDPYTVSWDMVAVPENLWFFFSLGIIVPFYMRKKRKKNFATITRQYIK